MSKNTVGSLPYTNRAERSRDKIFWRQDATEQMLQESSGRAGLHLHRKMTINRSCVDVHQRTSETVWIRVWYALDMTHWMTVWHTVKLHNDTLETGSQGRTAGVLWDFTTPTAVLQEHWSREHRMSTRDNYLQNLIHNIPRPPCSLYQNNHQAPVNDCF